MNTTDNDETEIKRRHRLPTPIIDDDTIDDLKLRDARFKRRQVTLYRKYLSDSTVEKDSAREGLSMQLAGLECRFQLAMELDARGMLTSDEAKGLVALSKEMRTTRTALGIDGFKKSDNW